MAQRLLDLAGEQPAIMSEVPFEGVPVDHDPVLEPLGGDPVAEVLAVGPPFEAEVGDEHRHRLQDPLEFLGEGVDRVCHERLEAVRRRLIHWSHVSPATIGEFDMREDQPASRRKPRSLAAALAVIALALGGVVWSGCGGGDEATDTVRDQAEKQVEEGTKKAEEAIEDGVDETKKGLEEAREEIEQGADGKTKKKLEEAREDAEEGLEEGRAKAEKGLEEAQERAEDYLP